MKTAKPPPAGDSASSRRAQPTRQARTNPARSGLPRLGVFGTAAAAAAAAAMGAAEAGALPMAAGAPHTAGESGGVVDIFPAVTHFADAIASLPRDLVRHFTLLKEVDAKIFSPEEDLARLVALALRASPPPVIAAAASGNEGSGAGAAAHMTSAQVAAEKQGTVPAQDPSVFEAANLPRRQLFQHCAYTMQNMLVSLDEKNHVISTAAEALAKQLARIDDVFPFIEAEFSDEARYGSLHHWAYPENRSIGRAGATIRRDARDGNGVNSLSTAAVLAAAEEAAARSENRRQAVNAKKSRAAESDLDDLQKKTQKKRLENGSSVNGPVNGVPAPKRRKVEKPAAGGTEMARSMSGVNGAASKAKMASPRATPAPEAKKKSRAAPNGQAKKRNGTTASAMSPSLASSPIRGTFPDRPTRNSPAPMARSASMRGRQNSTQSIQEAKADPTKLDGLPPDKPALPVLTSPSVVQTAAMPALPPVMKNELTEEVRAPGRQEAPVPISTAAPQKPTLPSIETVVTTKSGRASKPSTPSLANFPDIPPARPRSQRPASDHHQQQPHVVQSGPGQSVAAQQSKEKRSHKKGAGQVAQQQALIQAQKELAKSNGGDALDEEVDDDGETDEAVYCYCRSVSFGEMIACDGKTCEIEWFHLPCVGLERAPKNEKWFCDDCREKLKHKRSTAR